MEVYKWHLFHPHLDMTGQLPFLVQMEVYIKFNTLARQLEEGLPL
jgi:hypothetical protein